MTEKFNYGNYSNYTPRAMTATENGKNYTTISILPTTKTRLGDCMPKGWDWDRIILALTEMWENELGKGTKTGKSAQNSQIS